MRRMSLAVRPQSLMSLRMSFSLRCWARPRIMMVLLGSSSSSLKRKKRESER